MNDKVQGIIEGLQDNQVYLPVGYTDDEGQLHRVVELTGMTGETEEAIADPKVRDNGGKIVTELLASVVTKIGNRPRVTKEMIRNLSVIDRDFLLLKSREYSMGETITYIDTCKCGGKNEININIPKIECNYLEDEAPKELSFELPNGYKDANGTLHKKITVVLPTGVVQERIAQAMRVNPAQATTTMLQLITKSLGEMQFINPDVFRKMTKRDRDFISQKIGEVKGGVSLSTEVTCSDCGRTFTTTIPLFSLLGE